VSEYTFISYTHEDTRFVLKLARHLRQQGVVVWLDQWDIPPEAEWDRAIERAIRACSCFLVVLSPLAVNSWVVHNQLLLAMRTGKTIIPVLYQPCAVPSVLQDIPYIDFTGRDYKAALGQLLTHYFPEQKVQLEYRSKLVWDDLSWAWSHDLLPLLWPGWLGPLILLLLLVAGSIILFRSRDRAEASSPVSAIKTLSIVQPTPTPQLLPTPIKTAVRAADGKVIIYVPAGEFLMGSTETDSLANEDEKPQHRVYLDAFWIDKTEITNVQYQLCVAAGTCPPPRSQGKRFDADHQPVVGVDWLQAVAYCQWSGGRLPTEAEWEKAARGTDGRIYPWGNEFDGSRLNFCDVNCMADWKDRRVDDGYRFTAPVGSFPAGASPYGVLDMSGNVWEWTADWYAVDYYSRSAYENPTGPVSGQQRVVRGGSWYYYGKNLRVVNRHRDSPTYRYDNIGFRCVMPETE
jgi:formylglycine-generating enzyme required for sulfatase activity